MSKLADEVRGAIAHARSAMDDISAAVEAWVIAVDNAILDGPTTPPPPPPIEPPVTPQPSGPYRVVKHGSVPGADELTDPAKYPFKVGDTVWKAVNPRGQVSWYVAEKNDPKPSVDGFELAFTL